MKKIPFWVDDFPRPEGLTSDLPSETDYLVIGSGFTGLSAALRLAEGGHMVTVIDAQEIAGGASSMNGGMVSPDVKAGVGAVHSTYGPAIAGEMWAATVRSVDIVKDLNNRSNIDALIHQGGMAALGRGPRSLKTITRHVTWYREQFGVDWEVFQGQDIQEIVGGDYFDVVMFEPEGFGIHPARLAFGLATEVDSHGARLVDHCAAIGMEKKGAGLRVNTTKGIIDAGDVILATNGYTTRRPSKEMARLVVPIGSYIIATEPLGADRASSIFPGGAMTYTRKRLLNYMRRSPDDRIMIGGRQNLRPDLDLEQSAVDLRSSLITYWPELANVEITHVWGGRLGIPFDLIPHIGRIDEAWYAMGYGGHGVGLSIQLGHELAGMLLGEDPPSVFSQIRHQGRFYYSGRNPWFLTPASLLFRTLDRVGL